MKGHNSKKNMITGDVSRMQRSGINNNADCDHSRYNMAFIQTTIRRTIVVILIFALIVRLQMHYGFSIFQRQQSPRGDHFDASAAKRHSTSRTLVSELTESDLRRVEDAAFHHPTTV